MKTENIGKLDSPNCSQIRPSFHNFISLLFDLIVVSSGSLGMKFLF